nr:uncharacterized protein LOC122269252 [Parasteatoda tepidariorum]
MFKGAKKEDLRQIAIELGENVTETMTIIELTNLIKNNETFVKEPELATDIANTIINDRKAEKESLLQLEKFKFERTKAELELAKLRNENKFENSESTESLDSLVKSVRTLTVKVPSRPEGWSYFFSSLERAFNSKSVPEKYKAEILLNLLGEKATNVITYIKDNELNDYSKVKSIVIREFEPTPQSCLEHFKNTFRQPNETHVQYASRLITNYDYYLKLRKVSDFETLKELIVSDKIYQTLDKDTAYHISMKQGDDWFKPSQLSKEIDLYYTSRGKKLVNSLENVKNPHSKNASRVFLSDAKISKCVLSCSENHPLYNCPAYKNLSINDRVEVVKTNKLCFNCLGNNHRVSNCKSKYSCQNCKRRHHVTLHFSPEKKPYEASATASRSVLSPTAAEFITNPSRSAEVNQNKNEEYFAAASFDSNSIQSKCVLLSTIICYIKDNVNNLIPCRGLLDVGANSNFISKRLSDRLNLRKEKINASVSGLNELSLEIKSRVSTTITNEEGNFNLDLNFLVVPRIMDFTPSKPIQCSFPELRDVKLADLSFNMPGPIDILIGAEHFYEIMRIGQIQPPNTKLILQNTVFGYVVSGSIPTKNYDRVHCGLIKDNTELEKSISRFWELESIGINDENENIDENEALKNFNDTVSFKNKRYEVTLPWKRNWQELDDNFNIAKKRLDSLIKRMNRDNSLYLEYCETLKIYLREGIIERVLDHSKPNDKPVFYLPHLIVNKKERLTTKMRIVFDASAHGIGQLSLNDCLFQGVNLNPNIFYLLIHFRLNRIAFLADIEKAFLQISLSDRDRDAVRFLFGKDLKHIEIYRFKRVIFGVNSSPFLLAATIKKHIEKYRKEFPSTVQVLDDCLYVDDLIAGEDSEEAAFEISKRAKQIMGDAGMNLRKWISNDENLMKKLNEEGFDLLHPEDLEGNLHRVLGLSWNPLSDFITVEIDSLLEFLQQDKNTKRFLLMAAGRIFDPLGLLTPFTIRFKCLFQEIWQRKITWDEELPPDIAKTWKKWCTEVSQLKDLKIPRHVMSPTGDENLCVEIHTFSDASIKAYGAAVYIKIRVKDQIITNLVSSKTRVAPLKKITLPRMELMGAVLAARLAKEVKKVIDRKHQSTSFFWTDAKIVLYWIQSSTKRWKPFVANRVKEIQALTAQTSWHHCASRDNPADMLSRGVTVDVLLGSAKWWSGPDFLKENIPDAYEEQTVHEEEYQVELKKNCDSHLVTLISIDNASLFEKILTLSNNYTKIIHVLSFLFRFIYNCKNPDARKIGPLLVSELNAAEIWLLKCLQRSEFPEEIKSLEKGKPVPRNSKLSSLCVFLDENKLMRVGGRLSLSDLPVNSKFPIILPGKNSLTTIILRYCHLKYLHLGPQALLYQVRQKFWPLNGRNNCRKIVHSCITCFKNKPVMSNQIMADLPKERTRPNYPFNITGIDFCGPFSIKFKNQRKGVTNKVYVAVYICLCTKAIHLDFVTDLTSQSFIASLKRFFGRRGKCSKIMTDNAKTFIGANIEIKKLRKLINCPDETLASYFTNEGIDWKFIPPRSPNFGGIWEDGVKSFKFHLKRVIGNQNLTLEDN